MNTNFNPFQLLTHFSSSESSTYLGRGYVEINSSSATWRIYIKNGELKYVESSVQSVTQLHYYLSRQGWDFALVALKEQFLCHLSDRGNSLSDPFKQGLFEKAITWLQSEGHLDNTQVLQLIEDITQDALESFLWLSEGTTRWVSLKTNPFWVEKLVETNFDLSDLVKFLQKRLREWQSCTPAIGSPHQRPYLLDYRQLEKPVPAGTLPIATLKKLAQLMRGLSLRQISLILKQDELHLCQLLSPYIQEGVIYLRQPQPPFNELPQVPRSKTDEVVKKVVKIYKIVCIDDSPTVLNQIQRFLGEQRFQITTVNDPVQASSVIFRIKPDLILLDITMPKINGYKLCSLLRSSGVFNETPIIMVTGNKGLLDKARAKLSGATDYLTKPFTKEALMNLVEKYLEPIESNH